MWSAVATELALDILKEAYPDSKIITLRYHQHIPAPDGLVNQDGEDRIASYDTARVPSIALDGALLEMGGSLDNTASIYHSLRLLIDPRLKQSTPVRVTVEGKLVEGELTIQAEVTGVSEEILPSCRLRLAIAEDDVDALTPIGLRGHSMVVREMPGGAKGIAPKKGELKYSFSLPFAELQKHVNDHLDRFELGKGLKIPPTARPQIDGPLYLVAWVQNEKYEEQRPDIGRAVLQSAVVRIAGTGVQVEGKGEPAAQATSKPTTPADEPTTEKSAAPEKPVVPEKAAVSESAVSAPPPPALPE